MKYFTSKKSLSCPIIFTCEHASPFIPRKFFNLGLTAKDLKNSKDVYDPGALEMARALATSFKATLVHPNFSRLVIDPNRTLEGKTKESSTQFASALKLKALITRNGQEVIIDVPGNNVPDLIRTEEDRWEEYVRPYYEEIKTIASELQHKFGSVYIFQIHTMFPVYYGDVRKVDICVSHNDAPFAKKQIEILKSVTHLNLNVGDNEPWGMKAVGGGVLGSLQDLAGYNILGLDINSKNLKTKKQISGIVNLVKETIEQTLDTVVKK